jgi:hypothetical protein
LCQTSVAIDTQATLFQTLLGIAKTTQYANGGMPMVTLLQRPRLSLRKL